MSFNTKLGTYTKTFYIQLQKTTYFINAPVNNMIMRLANNTQVDLFNFNSIASFYNYIIRYLISKYNIIMCELCFIIILMLDFYFIYLHYSVVLLLYLCKIVIGH